MKYLWDPGAEMDCPWFDEQDLPHLALMQSQSHQPQSYQSPRGWCEFLDLVVSFTKLTSCHHQISCYPKSSQSLVAWLLLISKAACQQESERKQNERFSEIVVKYNEEEDQIYYVYCTRFKIRMIGSWETLGF